MIKSSWRLLTGPPQRAAFNMAVDEAIAIAFSEGKSPATLRFYQWSPPCFSIGAFQKLHKDWIAALENQKLTLVRRLTGGRGVLHDNELTYAIVAHVKNPLFSNTIKGTFQAVANGIITGLRPLGIKTLSISQNRPARSAAKNPLCFDAVSWHEITANGKKLIGSAQRRWSTHFLQHGSLILKHSQAFIDSNCDPGFPLISKNQITLSELIPEPPSDNTLIQHLKTGFETALGINLCHGEISNDEHNIIERLIREKYNNRNWTLYRQTTEQC